MNDRKTSKRNAKLRSHIRAHSIGDRYYARGAPGHPTPEGKMTQTPIERLIIVLANDERN